MTLEAHGRVYQYDESDNINTSEELDPTKVRQSVQELVTSEEVTDTAEILSPKNASIFEKMSAGGKVIATGIYEGLKNIPGAKWLVGKIGIAYNEKRMFGEETKAAKLKTELDTLSNKSIKLAASKKGIETIANRLEQKNIPGSEAIRLKLREIDNEINSLQNKQDTVQSKIEAKNNKISIFSNKRDSIANKLISHYEEKLAPLEENLARLETSRDQLELIASVAQARYAEQKIRMTDIENEKNNIESLLRDYGMSESEIKNDEAVRALGEEITAGQKSIRLEEEDMAKRKAHINKKIAGADAKANPHRDNRDAFVRVKQGRPMEIELTERTREKDSDLSEDVSSNVRLENTDVTEYPEDLAENVNKPKFTMQSAVLNWNRYLSTIADQEEARSLHIDENLFLLAIKSTAEVTLGAENFKQVFVSYLKYKKVATLGTNKTIDSFLESINKSN